MVGKTISHYKIIENIGRGGMVMVSTDNDRSDPNVLSIHMASNELGASTETRHYLKKQIFLAFPTSPE